MLLREVGESHSSIVSSNWIVLQFYCYVVQLAIELCECPFSRRTARARHVFVTLVCTEKLRTSHIYYISPRTVTTWCNNYSVHGYNAYYMHTCATFACEIILFRLACTKYTYHIAICMGTRTSQGWACGPSAFLYILNDY